MDSHCEDCYDLITSMLFFVWIAIIELSSLIILFLQSLFRNLSCLDYPVFGKNVTPSIEERVIHEPSTYTMMLFYYKLKLYSDISLQQRFKVCNSRGIWEIVNISIETNGSIEMSCYLVISCQQ